MLHLYVDGDGCPVKQEIYRVARRYGLSVTLVSNAWMRIPREDWLDHVMVGDGLDEADDWIVDHVNENDIVITGDIPLASRCLLKGAFVLDHRGGEFTESNIGHAMASRELMSRLRESGSITGGPRPQQGRDRSGFLQRLDQTIHSIRRKNPSPTQERD